MPFQPGRVKKCAPTKRSGGNGRAAAARGRWRVATLRPRRLAVLRFRGFPAYCAAPSHVALPVADGLNLPQCQGGLCNTAKLAAVVRVGSFASLRANTDMSASPPTSGSSQSPLTLRVRANCCHMQCSNEIFQASSRGGPNSRTSAAREIKRRPAINSPVPLTPFPAQISTAENGKTKALMPAAGLSFPVTKLSLCVSRAPRLSTAYCSAFRSSRRTLVSSASIFSQRASTARTDTVNEFTAAIC